MKRPARLVLVRHAESERNVAKKGSAFFEDDESRRSVRGVPDYQIPITTEGWRQARATGAALHERFGVFDIVYHSGYRRTIDTADALLSAYGEVERKAMLMRMSVFVRERDAGYAYDMTTAEAKAAFPWLEEYWRTSGSFFARPPGGESVAQLCERVHLFLDELCRDHDGKRVLVVTHGITLRAFRFLLENLSYEDVMTRLGQDPPDNCSVTTYEYDPHAGQLVLQDYNRVYWRLV